MSLQPDHVIRALRERQNNLDPTPWHTPVPGAVFYSEEAESSIRELNGRQLLELFEFWTLVQVLSYDEVETSEFADELASYEIESGFDFARLTNGRVSLHLKRDPVASCYFLQSVLVAPGPGGDGGGGLPYPSLIISHMRISSAGFGRFGQTIYRAIGALITDRMSIGDFEVYCSAAGLNRRRALFYIARSIALPAVSVPVEWIVDEELDWRTIPLQSLLKRSRPSEGYMSLRRKSTYAQILRDISHSLAYDSSNERFWFEAQLLLDAGFPKEHIQTVLEYALDEPRRTDQMRNVLNHLF